MQGGLDKAEVVLAGQRLWCRKHCVSRHDGNLSTSRTSVYRRLKNARRAASTGRKSSSLGTASAVSRYTSTNRSLSVAVPLSPCAAMKNNNNCSVQVQLH